MSLSTGDEALDPVKQIPTESSITIMGSGSGKKQPAGRRLPLEVLLMIYGMSEKPARVMLSFTCRRMFNATNEGLHQSTCTFEERIAISRLLEIDMPEHLTCRLCGYLFKWRHRRSFSYECPRQHNAEDRQDVLPLVVPIHYRFSSMLNFEVRDLIYRYYTRGSQKGINANFLTRAGKNILHRPQYTRARWIENQLVVHTNWTLELRVSWSQSQRKKILFCPHLRDNWTQWRTFKKSPDPRYANQMVETLKCRCCACDVTITHSRRFNGSTVLSIEAWRSYGSSGDGLDERPFRKSSSQRIDEGVVAQRDLRKLFESGEDESSDDGGSGGHDDDEDESSDDNME